LLATVAVFVAVARHLMGSDRYNDR
jgi:hypothetical protein